MQTPVARILQNATNESNASGELDGGRALAEEYTRAPLRAALFTKVINAINTLSKTVGASPNGYTNAPAKIQALNVKVGGEILHATALHASEINQGVHYFWELGTNDPSFGQPLVFHTGTSRHLIVTLPSNDDDSNPVNYYLRAYPQYQGSKPAEPTTHGGDNTPTAITMSGTTSMTLLPSTGSGTANTNGTQSGWGWGRTLVRAATTVRS